MLGDAPCSLILIVLRKLKKFCLFYLSDGYFRNLKLFYKRICETLVKLLYVYNSARASLASILGENTSVS